MKEHTLDLNANKITSYPVLDFFKICGVSSAVETRFFECYICSHVI